MWPFQHKIIWWALGKLLPEIIFKINVSKGAGSTSEHFWYFILSIWDWALEIKFINLTVTIHVSFCVFNLPSFQIITEARLLLWEWQEKAILLNVILKLEGQKVGSRNKPLYQQLNCSETRRKYNEEAWWLKKAGSACTSSLMSGLHEMYLYIMMKSSRKLETYRHFLLI